MPSSITQDLEVVSGLGIFHDKLEALFNTWAFVSIQEPDWFSFQDALTIMDILNGLFKQRYRGGARPPLEFFVKAYSKTMNQFLDEVSTHERKLSEVVKETSSWIHIWNSWDPPPVQPHADRDRSEAGAKDPVVPSYIKSQMNRLNQMAVTMSKTLQQQKNSYQANAKGWGKNWGKERAGPYSFPPIHPVLDQSQWGNGKGKGKGKGKGGGKGKGKGKGKGWGK